MNVDATGNLSDIIKKFEHFHTVHRKATDLQWCCQHCGSPALCSGQVHHFCMVFSINGFSPFWYKLEGVPILSLYHFQGLWHLPQHHPGTRFCLLCHLSLFICICYMTIQVIGFSMGTIVSSKTGKRTQELGLPLIARWNHQNYYNMYFHDKEVGGFVND